MTGETEVESSQAAGGEENSQGRLSPSDIAKKHLEAAGFTGRAGTMLGFLLGSTGVKDTARKILSGEPVSTNSKEHRKQVEWVFGKMDENTANVVTGNIEPWRGLGSQDVAFVHVISGEAAELMKDTQVAYLIDSIRFVLSADGSKADQNGVDVNSFRPGLNEFATRVIGKSWEEIAAIAKEYAQSPLAGEIHQAAQTLHDKAFMEFLSDSLLSEYAVLQNPQGFIQAARATSKEAYGLDLDQVHPIDRDSPEGRAFLRKQWEEGNRAAKAAEAARATPPTVDLTTEAAPLDSAPTKEQQLERDISRWLLPNGRLNVVDDLTLEGLQNLAKELDLSIRDSEKVSEGELRRIIAIKMVSQWYQEGEQANDKEFAPFFLICGRGAVGFSGVIPEYPLDWHFQSYSFGNRRERMRTINELYERYWEDRKPEEAIKH